MLNIILHISLVWLKLTFRDGKKKCVNAFSFVGDLFFSETVPLQTLTDKNCVGDVTEQSGSIEFISEVW